MTKNKEYKQKVKPIEIEGSDKSIYKHFRLFTYDVVFNIIAVGFTLEVDLEGNSGTI